MNEIFGLGGKILIVDLSKRKVNTENTLPFSDRFLGGNGINIWKLLEMIPYPTSALDPENVLAFGAGVLVGTPTPGASRLTLQSKNAYTAGLGSANAGGHFAPELKNAGFDHLLIAGKAETPVYLRIDNDDVQIEDAGFLWGSTTWDTEQRLRSKINDPHAQILSIGPAGERCVQAACIMVNRSRAAGRCGLGAIMGSKKLKAIVVRGTKGIRIAQPEAFMETCRDMSRRVQRTEVAKNLRKYGTPISFTRWNADSAMPTQNFQQSQMALDLAEKMSHLVYKRDYITRSFGCFSCPIHCSQFQRVAHGPFAEVRGEKIESQTIWDFGAKLGIDDPAAILRLSLLCSELGLDIDNTSGAISWALECSQRGILSEQESDGMDLRWGDPQVVEELVQKIARREGLGALLAKGSREAARIVGKGSEKYVMHIKGQELAEELRRFKGWALGVSVSSRGGAHTMGAPLTERMDIDPKVCERLFGVKTASIPDTYEGKARLVHYFEKFHALLDALGVCFFTSNWMSPELLSHKDYLQLYNLATGNDIDESKFIEFGEKIVVLGKMFNVKHTNFSPKDDYPPDRFFDEPATGTDAALDRSQWSSVLAEYYELHGWEKTTGIPTKETLEKLELSELISICEDRRKGGDPPQH